MVDFTGETPKYRKTFNEDQLKRAIYHRRGITPSEIVLVKHPKQKEGWYGVHLKSRRAFESFPEAEDWEVLEASGEKIEPSSRLDESSVLVNEADQGVLGEDDTTAEGDGEDGWDEARRVA